MPSTTKLPNIAATLAPILNRVAIEKRPLLIAAAERMAADRYREWSRQVSDEQERQGLLECAEREEAIARRVEGLFENAGALQKELLAQSPELIEGGKSLFAALSLADQFALQAQGERLGAATWRSYAASAKGESARSLFLECALLEEKSAEFLESL